MPEVKEILFEQGNVKIEGTVYLMPANPELGYNFGYAVFIPAGCNPDTTMIMHACNTGGNVPARLSEAEDIAKKSTYERPNLGAWIGSDLNMPVIIPLIPRVRGYYTQAMGSAVFENDISNLILDQEKREPSERLTEEEISEIQARCYDIPSQVVNMIESSQSFLNTMGISVDEKVIVQGYSAGSRFANTFTSLHPEMVKACISGGNSGLGILPISEYQGQQLNFPLGTANVSNFDYESFRQIPQLYYIGTEDYNDPAMCKCEMVAGESGPMAMPLLDSEGRVIPILDASGMLQPRYPETFSQAEVTQIHTLLGDNPQNRFLHSAEIYNQLGINAIFKRFPGNHNTVTQNGDEHGLYVNEAIKEFISKVLEQERDLQGAIR